MPPADRFSEWRCSHGFDTSDSRERRLDTPTCDDNEDGRSDHRIAEVRLKCYAADGRAIVNEISALSELLNALEYAHAIALVHTLSGVLDRSHGDAANVRAALAYLMSRLHAAIIEGDIEYREFERVTEAPHGHVRLWDTVE